MGFAATMIFYHLIGAGVAVAMYLAEPEKRRLSSLFRTATAVVFWPLYLPILLSSVRPQSKPEVEAASTDDDTMSRTIVQVEAELETALASLDGWVEDVLAHENDRFHELSTAWRAQASRIREMDRLLARTGPAGPERTPADGEASDRCRQSEESRRANLERLRQVRNKAFDDLMGTLAWVRELVSMIHLAKYTGAPASRAEELVAQIAAAIEGISAVTWQEVVPGNNNSNGSPKRRNSQSAQSRDREEIASCNFSSASATSSPPI
jgi:hypothetical protein